MLTGFFQDSDFIVVLQTGFGSGSGFLPRIRTGVGLENTWVRTPLLHSWP